MLKLHMRQMWEFVAVISPLFNDKQLHTSLPKLYILFWPFSIVYKSPPHPLDINSVQNQNITWSKKQCASNLSVSIQVTGHRYMQYCL